MEILIEIKSSADSG